MTLDELKAFAKDIAQYCDATRVDLIGGPHEDEPIVGDLEVTLRHHSDPSMNDLTERAHRARLLRDETYPDVAIFFTFGHDESRSVGLPVFEA